MTIGIIRLMREPGAVAVLVVHGVHDGAAAVHLQRGLDDRRLGRVDDQRDGRRRGEAPDDLPDVGDAVAADVVDAHVEQVRAVLDLVLRDAHAVVPALLEHRLAELLGAVGVRALPDGEVRRVLPERHVLVHARRARVAARRARDDLAAADALDDEAQVLRRGAAAPADEAEAVLAGERVVGVGQLLRGQGVARALGREHRQTRVRHAGDADLRVAGEVA
ncbi:MAG: hypothetical protein U0R76_05665 [Candidatus Nanopelagicales bacterium]